MATGTRLHSTTNAAQLTEQTSTGTDITQTTNSQ